ncbi:MAG: hypothetical protein ACI8RU_002956 [Zhongshania aliphaticivorans]|jgi:hypothetical protein
MRLSGRQCTGCGRSIRGLRCSVLYYGIPRWRGDNRLHTGRLSDTCPASIHGGNLSRYACCAAQSRLARPRFRGIGKPDGFNARHFKRIKSLIPDDVNLSPAFAELSQWLATNIPIESDACIVHNDFRIGNVMWKATGPTQLLTVLDWELATLGDPLFDLAYFINCYPGHGIPRTPTQDLAAAVLEDGYLEPADLIARYVVGRGRDVSNVKWNQVFVDWKLAILYEYSRLRGGDDYYQQGGLVERFLHAALRHIAS